MGRHLRRYLLASHSSIKGIALMKILPPVSEVLKPMAGFFSPSFEISKQGYAKQQIC